jgi:hypothetical protein
VAIALALRLFHLGCERADAHRLLLARHDHAYGLRKTGGATRQVHDEHHWKLEALRGVHGHQVHRIHGLEDRIRLVSRAERVEMLGEPRHRRVAAVLDAANEPAHLLDVLPRLLPPRAADLVRVRRFAEDLLEQLR